MTGTGGEEEGHDRGVLLVTRDEVNLKIIAPCHTAIIPVTILWHRLTVFEERMT